MLTGLPRFALWEGLRRCWVKGLVLRSERAIYEPERLNKGRAGRPRNLRPFHLYALRPHGVDELRVKGSKLVRFSESARDPRGGNGKSKAQAILEFLRVHGDRAYFSREVSDALKAQGVKPSDIMANLRRYEEKGLVYVRGYRGHDHRSPFKEGFLLTWIEQGKLRDEALAAAIERTNRTLADRETTNPVIQRIHRVRDLILESTKLRDLASFTYVQSTLGCSDQEAENGLERALQLYSDLKEVKLFEAYRYFYHDSIGEADLKAAVALKMGYVRKIGSQRFRIGHNWEAVTEWFIDKFTIGADFQSQQHRTAAIDPRRITLRLIKSVHGRRNAAEVDRVWTVTSGVFAPPVTYVLSCKWGLIHKEDVDDFLEVLKWSKEFGVDTTNGRQVKQGIMGVFAGGAFNPKENVKVKDGTAISLPSYAARMNIQLLKATDFNSKLRERECPPSVNVQKVCRIARDEREVRQLLSTVWTNAPAGEGVLLLAESRNKDLYEFEKSLETRDSPASILNQQIETSEAKSVPTAIPL